jgi:hypothetical protein
MTDRNAMKKNSRFVFTSYKINNIKFISKIKKKIYIRFSVKIGIPDETHIIKKKLFLKKNEVSEMRITSVFQSFQ